jgi:acyl carrier protein
MSSDTLNLISDIIVEVCGLDRATLLPAVNAVDDLGIDSIDFLDIIYEIQQRLGIKVPVEDWMEQINSGKARTADYFVLSRLAERIDELVGLRPASAQGAA